MTNPTQTTKWPSAADIMQSDVVTIPGSAPLDEVERLLSEHRIGGAPVTDEAGQIVGVLSLRDLVDRYVDDPDARPRREHGFYAASEDWPIPDEGSPIGFPDESNDVARDVMTAQIHSVPHDAPLPAIARKMVDLGLHRMLVTRQRQVVGLLTTVDMLKALTELD